METLNRRHGASAAAAGGGVGEESDYAVWNQGSDSDREAALEEEELNERYRYKNSISRDYEYTLNKDRRKRRRNKNKSCLNFEQWMVIIFTTIVCVSMFLIGIQFQSKKHSYALPWNEVQQTEINVNWPDYMKKLDPLWSWVRPSDAPSTYGNSPFMGNGNLGLTVRVDNDETNRIRFDIGRSDIYFGTRRFPVGCLWIDLAETTTKTKMGSLRTHLWDAVTDGSIGYLDPISITSFVHATKDIIVISLKTPVSFDHEKFISFKPGYYGNPNPPEVRPEKPPVCEMKSNSNVCTQEFSGAANSFSVAWSVVADVSSTTPQVKNVIIYLTVSPVAQLSESKALSTLMNAKSTSYEDLLSSHKEWWNSYYPSSFITLDNIT